MAQGTAQNPVTFTSSQDSAPGQWDGISFNTGTNNLPTDIDENSLSRNAKNAIFLTGNVTASTSWEHRGYPIVLLSGAVNVNSGATLTLGPGLVLKGEPPGGLLRIDGNLQAQGTQADPITFTSVKDDSVGGDTNGDGSATTPAGGDWKGIYFNQGSSGSSPSGTGAIDHAKVMYGGGYPYADVLIGCPCATPPTIRHSTLAYSGNVGLYVTGDPGGSQQVLKWSKLQGNPTYGVHKTGTTTLNAGNNNWNSASGPKPAGTGDGASSLVSTAPYESGTEYPCPGADDSQCPEGADPVALATGDFTYAHTDLRLTSTGLPLEFSRAYSSGERADAGLGLGWSHPGLISATELESGDVVIRHGDGRQDLFTKTLTGYTAPSGVHGALVKNTDGTYELTSLDRTVYDFDASGRIDKITDDHGLITDYAYNTQTAA